MNPTDLRAELLEKVDIYLSFAEGHQFRDIVADFALPYAERAAELQAKLDEANDKIEDSVILLDAAKSALAASQQRDWS